MKKKFDAWLIEKYDNAYWLTEFGYIALVGLFYSLLVLIAKFIREYFK